MKTTTDEETVRTYFSQFGEVELVEIPEDKAWEIVGGLLTDGDLESIHDEFTGEMKLCEAGKTYLIMNLEQQRKRQKSQEFKMNKKQKSK